MSSLSERLSAQDGGVDLDLDEVWSQAVEEYEQTTGIPLTITSNQRGFDAVAKDIDDKLRRSKSGNRAKAQQVMNGAMKCLQRFGSIVAQATSVVFEPSAQCWNAINFIISAAQSYQAILDGFAALMERSVVFLERLNLDLEAKKEAGMPFDSRLRKSTYKILAHFLNVVGNSHKLATSKRQKMKTVFKIVLFNDDAGVSANLTRMETLVRDLTDTKVSVILQDVQGLARFIRDSEEEINRNEQDIKASMERFEGKIDHVDVTITQMKLEQDQRVSQDKNTKDLKKIRDALDVKDGDPWSKPHLEITRRRTPGTGLWLLQKNLVFTSWSDVYVDATKVITLTGKQGFGKSHICSHVIDHLLSKYPKASSGTQRASVAYYYFSSVVRDESLEKCLGSIVYQFAKSDGSYAKAAATVCERPESLAGADVLWRRLVTDLKNVMHGTYFIVIDGFKKVEGDERVDNTFEAMVDMAQAAESQASIRLFVSGQATELGLPAFSKPGIAEVPLGSTKPMLRPGFSRTRSRFNEDDWETERSPEPLMNEADLVAFTRNRIEFMCKDKEYMAATLRDPTLDAVSTLAAGVRGNYSNLEVKLDQINACDDGQEVSTIIKQATEDPVETLKRDVDSLYDTLTTDELEELNQLLLWVTGAFESTDIKLLKAAIGNKTLWLEKHIPEKFYKLLSLDDKTSEVVVRRSELIDVLSKGEIANDHEDATNMTSQPPNMVLQRNEIEIVERVVRTFCGDELYDKFGFKKFFNTKAGQKDVRIHLPDDTTVNMVIFRRCLEALCQNQEDEMLAPLRQYSAYWFEEHMKNIELLQAERIDLRAVGGMLASILWDKSSIDAWWSVGNLVVLRSDWVINDAYFDSLMEWLKYPLVAAGYQGEEEKNGWLRSAVRKAEEDDHVLSRVAQRLADRWFGAVRANPNNFWCAYGLMARAWQLPSDEDIKPDVPQINRFALWAQEHSDLDVSEAHWKMRTASTFIECKHNEEALVACVEAKAKGPETWGVLLCAARANANLKNYRESLDCLHKIKDLSPQLLNSDEAYAEAYWDTVLLLEGQNHKALSDFDAAASCFITLLSHNFDDKQDWVHKEATTALFSMWNQNKSYAATIDLFLKWRDVSDGAKSISYWLLMLAGHEDFQVCMVSASVHTGKFEAVCETYKKTINEIDPDEQQWEIRMLHYFHASILFHSSPSEVHRKEALDHWEELVTTSGDDWTTYWPARITTKKLSRYLLDQAVLHNITPMSDAAQRYAEKLERLSKMSVPVLRDCRESGDDPRLALARLKTLAGDREGAREVVLDRMRSAFDEWPEVSDESSLIARYDRLAHTLTVLDNDETAVAAWRLLEPSRPKADVKDDEVLSGATQGAEDSGESQDPAGDAELKMNGHLLSATDTESPAKSKAPNLEPHNLDDLESFVGFSCDGGCGMDWKAIGDLYVCKYCLDVQMCPSCHQRLLDGDIHPLMCSKAHSFLYVPPFDRAAWEKTDPELMWVGNSLVPRRAWIEGLRDDWGLHQDHIDAHKLTMAEHMRVAMVLTRLRRLVLKKRAATSTSTT